MNEEIILNVTENSPYVIGAVACVEQLEDGAKITIIDKNGTTTAVVNNGNGIQSVTLNEDYTLTIYYTDGTSVTTTSIRGETGESGVYIGEEEPENPDVNVWIDPSNGYNIPTPPVEDGTYVLQAIVEDGVPTLSWVSAD